MNHIDLIIPIVAPLLAAAISLSVGWRTVTKWANSLAAVTILGTGLLFAFGPRLRHVELFGGLLRSDPLSSLLLIAIGAVGSLVTVSSVDYIERELSVGATDRSDARQYATLVPLFLTTMVVVVLSNNLGLIWIAIEATTITTAFLVGHHRTRLSLEATWKYVVICSFGITLAFLGTVLLYFASVHSGSSPADALNLDTLVRRAGRMDKTVTRLAMGLLLIGFGTKAGLFPFHTWLADAHSQAPAPISGLMSGILLSVAFSVVLRLKVVGDAALGVEYVRNSLLIVGIATLTIAVSLMVSQRDLKRLLAYSSLEQMGFIAVASAAGTELAFVGVLMVIVGNALAKTVLFIAAGQLQSIRHSTLIEDLNGVMESSRLLGVSMMIGLVGLVGLPPFALFVGELSIARAMVNANLVIPLLVTLLLLLVGFVSLIRHLGGMLLGPRAADEPTWKARPSVYVTLTLGLSASLFVGLVGGPFSNLVSSAAAVVAR